MIIETIKKNSVIVSYDMTSDEGTKVTKRQSFNIMSFDATKEDFYAIGSAIGSFLAQSPKEISKNNTILFTEA